MQFGDLVLYGLDALGINVGTPVNHDSQVTAGVRTAKVYLILPPTFFSLFFSDSNALLRGPSSWG